MNIIAFYEFLSHEEKRELLAYLNKKASEIEESDELTLLNWVKEHSNEMSIRLYNTIRAACNDNDSIFYKTVTIKQLQGWRNMGKKLITEFVELRGY